MATPQPVNRFTGGPGEGAYRRSGAMRRNESASAMWARLMGDAVEGGDGARDAQHPVVTAQGQAHALGRAQQQLAPGGVGLGDPCPAAPVGLSELWEYCPRHG